MKPRANFLLDRTQMWAVATDKKMLQTKITKQNKIRHFGSDRPQPATDADRWGRAYITFNLKAVSLHLLHLSRYIPSNTPFQQKYENR